METETHKTWFEISNQGWKRMNAGRPLGQLVREAISNVFDAPGVTRCTVTAKVGEIIIDDDAPAGITDKSLVTTVFLTDKEDSHLMRGRKGRGLKELIAAATSASVQTVGYAVNFNEDGSRSSVDLSTRQCGTTVHVKNEEWTAEVVAACVAYLRKFIPPANITMQVNNYTIQGPDVDVIILDAKLPTTVIKDGRQVEIEGTSNIATYALRKGEKKGWVYEMGIPVQEIETPFHIDVAQRIPMNDNRDVVDAKYLPQLYAAVMRRFLDRTDRKDLTETWLLQGFEVADWSLQAAFVRKLVPDGYAIKSDDKLANDKAKQHGIKLVDISMLPGNAKWNIGYHGKDAIKVMKNLEESAPVTDKEELRDTYPTFVKVMEFLAEKLVDKPIKITFMAKLPSYTGHATIADYNAKMKLLRFNMDLEHTYFDQPIHPENLTTMIHELAHDKYSEHNDLFLEEVQRLAGKLAILCLTYQQTLYRMVKEGGSVAKAPQRTNNSKTLQAVCCTWPGCTAIRMVKPQDIHQVKYCAEHQAERTRQRAKERREAKKASSW